jgi:phosphohistidine phosphatase
VLTLLVLRHAKSSWGDPSISDHDRPLNKRGCKAAKKVGELLASKSLLPEIILASSALRVEQTVTLLEETSGYSGPVRVSRRLYLAEAETYVQCLNELSDSATPVMCVGHNPGLEELVARHTSRSERLPTAALAELRFDIGGWSELENETPAELVNLWRPKEL